MAEEKKQVLEIPCPVSKCGFVARGNIAPYNIKQHMEKHHPELYEKWLKDQGLEPSLQPTQEKQQQQQAQQQAQQIQTKQRQMPQDYGKLYEEIPEPEDWLRGFLDSYKLKEPFIQAQCARVKRRNQLPTPSDLMVDMKEADSGQRNLLMIRDIVEDYDFAVDEYMKKRDKMMNYPMVRRHGIPINRGHPLPSDREIYRGGIPIRDPYNQYPYDPQYPPQACDYPPQYPYSPQYERGGIPIQRPPVYPQPYQTLEQELERLANIQRLFAKTEEKNPEFERLERENQDIKRVLEQMQKQKQQELLQEMQEYKSQLYNEIQRRKELEQHIRDQEFKLAQQGRSETDVRYEEAKNKFELEKMKLEESGKTRDAVSTAIKGGLSSIGQAIARTATEVSTGAQTNVVGYQSGKHTWQLNCPACNHIINAPVDARIVVCPSCGGEFEVMNDQEEQPKQQFIPPSQPIPQRQQNIPERQSAHFTVDNQQQPEIEEPESEIPIENNTQIQQTEEAPREPPKRKTPTAAERSGNKKKTGRK